MMRKITVARLKEKCACTSQVELFEKLFPNGVVPTVDVCLEVADKFDWNWASLNLLSAPAQKAYDKATATALKAYSEATAFALKAYDKARAPALKAYDEATAPALKAYHEAMATAFAEGWE
jgi:hypothetical protein